MTPGRISIRDNQLVIEAPPHVSIRLRRVFGGAQRYKAGEFRIAATPEHAYDLDWFRERHPLDIEPADEPQFRQLVATQERKMAAIAAIDSTGYVPREFELALPPREYQRLAADLALKTGSLLICDALGVGKTVTAICTMTTPGVLPALVVTMTHLTRQWEAELRRFAPKLRVHRLRTRTPYDFTDVRIEVDPVTKRRGVVRYNGMPDVLIANYQKMDGWVESLAGKICSIYFDEAQELRHAKANGEPTKKYAAAKALADGVDLRCGLTGTPVYNYGEEIYNVLDVIAPGQLGTHKEFLDEWCGERTYDGKSKVADPAALGTYLREAGLMIRRTRKDVGREIPPLTVVRHVVECDPKSIERVTADVAELARRVLERIGKPVDRMQAASELDWRLRQATGIGKAGAVAEFVRMLVDSGERVLLGGWHHQCFARGTGVLMFDGSVRAVEDVSVGDSVMGPDSTPRAVLGLTRGIGPMYRVTPNRGKPWVCSSGHPLQLWSKRSGKERTTVMSASEFAGLTARQKRDYHMRRSPPVDFGGHPVKEPWLLGYWLGDGNSWLNNLTVSVATTEPEIVDALRMIARRYDLRVMRNDGGAPSCAFYRFSGPLGHKHKNHLLNLFKSLDLDRNKHVPLSYKMAPIQDRRRILAGLLDSDGHVSQRIPGNAVFTSVSRVLADDAAFIARSLGLAATISTSPGYPNQLCPGKNLPVHNVYISGDLHEIPTLVRKKRSPPRAGQKNVLHVGFDVSLIGDGEFFGFETDGDHLFLLDDFTIVHNCYALIRANFDRPGSEIRYEMFTGEESDSQKASARERFCNGDAQVLIMSNRAGAGLDGLQFVCRTAVIGELDWSPKVIEQFIGRVHRDGQTDPVVAYILVAEEGSDPVISDVLGIKDAQATGIVDPGSVAEPVFQGASDDHIRRLAEDVLKRRSRAA